MKAERELRQDLYHRNRSYRQAKEILDDYEAEDNRELIRAFEKEYGEGLSETRRTKYITRLVRFSDVIGKPFIDADRGDLARLRKHVDTCGVLRWNKKLSRWETKCEEASPVTRAEHRKIIKAFWRWLDYYRKTPEKERLSGQDLRQYLRLQAFPPEVIDLVANYPAPKQYQPRDMLTWADVVELSQAASNDRDKSFIQLIGESGARLGEILTLEIGDISLREAGGKTIGAVSLRESKTKLRTIGIVNSVPALRQWLAVHPFREDKSAALFCDLGQKKKGAKMSPQSKSMSPAAVRILLIKASKRSGITKKTNPHHFRKSRASALAHLLNEQEVKSLLGWQQDSKMFRVYSFVDTEKVNDKYWLSQGVDLTTNKPEILEEQRPVKCRNCGTTNPCGERQCLGCHVQLAVESKRMAELRREVWAIVESGELQARLADEKKTMR